MLYVIKTPTGELLEKTASAYQAECWNALQYECRKSVPLKLRKEISALTSWNAKGRNNLLRKNGFSCVKVSLVEAQG